MSIVCEEIFDENSHPSVDEIRDYAKKIGIDPDTEPELLPLAADGLMEALPAGWKPCYDDNRKCYYYYNNLTGKTQWEHPLDDVYRGLVKKVRTESQSLSLAAGEQTEDATFNQELPSFDEPHPKKLEQPLSTRKLAPLSPHKLLKQRSDDQLLKTHKTALFSCSFDEKIEVDKFKTNPELTVAGGGAMFLKTNTQKKNTEQTIPSPIRNEPKGILRERNCLEISKSMDFDKLPSEKSERDEDDKKSVRFNLDTNTDIAFTFSDKSLSDHDDDNDDDIASDKNIINVKIDNKLNKTRFTVFPVKEIDNNSNNLKLIKPNPTDFLQVSDDSNDDNSDEIQQKSKRLEEKAEKRMEKLKQNLWEEKNDELIKFRNDLQQSQDGEFERILIKTKQEYEEKIKNELENLRIEMENRKLGTLKEERLKFDGKLDEEKRQLQQKYDDDVKKMQEDYDNKREELEKYYEEKLVEIEKDLAEKVEKQRDELILINKSDIEQLKQNHTIIIEQLKRDFKLEEDCLRREHKNSVQELKNQLAHEQQLLQDNDDYKNRNYEKIRCEKRLLEDKYRCLKEKYLRLKTDVKLSIEKRNKRKEQSATTTTGSETEKSHSTNKDKTPLNSPLRKPPTPKHNRPEHRTTRQLIIQDLESSFSDKSDDKNNKTNDYDSSDNNSANPGRSRKRIFSRLKSSSTSRINNNNNSNNNNNNNNIGVKSRRNYTQQQQQQQRSCSPVENLRRQLQKLEDLEDQFPQPTAQTNNDCNDTYHLRYPFSDGQKFDKGSSELEFFRHRIHLERDSIKRAKESLRNQKSLFQQRQKELKLKHGSMARHTFQQLCQEEKELTDMEVSLHRTRSLLGEKVIRLRHLEQSLQRATMTTTATENRQDDTTLSDLSSHSASSGISSTEFATADGVFNKNHLQESSEIIQSLENLNSEIREIWDVLRKQQQQHTGAIAAVPIPSPFIYPDLGWPLLAGSTTAQTPGATSVAPPSIPTLADRLHNYRQQVALANAQSTMVTHATNQQGATTTLVERTRNLRHWLRQAGIENNLESGSNTPQATL